MLSNWCTELRKWKHGLWNEDPIKDQTTPDLKWEKWTIMKEQCHERDGWSCTDCGATEELEAHHIESVRDGGTPELDNLLTLCKTCHRGSTYH
jgi:5-methylcytosine-specific restriction endonuclease McrA